MTTLGLTTSVVGTGVEDGIPYVDVRFFGTPNATNVLQINHNAAVSASDGQTWCYSIYSRLSAGSLTNLGNATLALAGGSNNGSTSYTLTSTALGQTRRNVLVTNAGGSSVLPRWRITVTNGLAVDFTIRLGGVQLELGGFQTSLILPPVGAPAQSTRLLDSVSMTGTNLTSWCNSSTGTLYAQARSAAGGSGQRVVRLDDSTNAAPYVMLNRAPNYNLDVDTGVGVRYNNASQGAWANSTIAKLMTVYANTDVAWSVNGQTASVDTGPQFGTVSFSRITLGRQHTSANVFNGHILKLSYYPIRATNTQIRELTR